jgi:hypothetical protein
MARFVKGVSGNPGGRPRKTQEQHRVDEACRALSLEAVRVLEEIMRHGTDERNRLKAAETILNRGRGSTGDRPGLRSDAALLAELKRRGCA